MKKAIVFLLVILLVASLGACTVKRVERESKASSEKTGAEKEETVSLEIVMGAPFNEGMAIVNFHEKEGTYAIDDKGKILFAVTEGEYYYPETAFYDGIAVVHKGNFDYVLCDKNGELFEVEAFGGTRFMDFALASYEELLHDGFLVVENEEDRTIGVLNTAMEWIVPLSADVYNVIEESDAEVLYYNGYLVVEDDDGVNWFVNLRTGESGTDLSQIKLNHPMDLHYVNEDGEVYDFATGEKKFDLVDVNYLLNSGVKVFFRDGKALIKELVKTESGDKVFQTRYYIVDDAGNYITQPAIRECKIDGVVNQSIMYAQDRLIIADYPEQTGYQNDAPTTILIDTTWTVYDLDGKELGTYTVPAPPEQEGKAGYIYFTDFYINENGIKIKYSYAYYSFEYKHVTTETYTCYFDLDLNPLF